MSDLNTPLTADLLNDFFKRDRQKQERFADRLLVSPRTIDGWRNGRTIPDQYHEPLRRMMFGEDTIAIQLKPDVYEKLAAKAAEKGFKSPEAYISELLKGFLIITLLGLVAWQAFAPSENQFARKFGIRRRSDSCTVLDLGDADPFEG